MSFGQIVGGVVGAAVGFYLGGPMGAMMGASLGAGLGGIIDPLEPDIPSPGQPDIANLDVTTAQEGSVIMDFVGTTKMAGNIFYYGNSRSKKIKEKQESGGKGGSSSKKVVVGIEYYLTWAVGLASGPVDELYTVLSNDKVVWSGNLLRTDAVDGKSTITLDGMGSMTFFFGGTDQTADSTIGAAVGATANPSYRGLTWAFFNDCKLGDYNRVPTIRFMMRKTPVKAFNASNVVNTYTYNPMHAIWYIIEDMCELSTSWLSATAFSEVAADLYSEGLGVSLLFKHDEAKKYISSILQHVHAILPYGDDTGQFEPELIRSTTAITGLDLITDEDCLEPPDISSMSYMDTFNDVKVQYSQIYEFFSGKPVAIAATITPDDDFTFKDTEKWNFSSSAITCVGGELDMSVGPGQTFTTWSKWYFTGDFDCEVTLRTANHNPHVSTALGGLSNRHYTGGQCICESKNIHTGSGGTDYCSNYPSDGCGPLPTNGYVNNVTGDILESKMKMTRVGARIEVYIKHDQQVGYPLSSWILTGWDDNFGAGLTGRIPCRMYLRTYSDTNNPSLDLYWDDFIVNSGTVVWDAGTPTGTAATLTLDIRQATVHSEDPGNKETIQRIRHKDERMMLFNLDANARWGAAQSIRTSSIPLKAIEMKMDRRGIYLPVGKNFRYSSAKYGITKEQVYRVLSVREGNLDKEEFIINALQDPNYLSQIVVVDEADRDGSKFNPWLADAENPDIVEAPYAMVEENMFLVPLIGRLTGNELGYTMYMSTDGTTYSDQGSFESFVTAGCLAATLNTSEAVLDSLNDLVVDFYYDLDAQDINSISRSDLIAGKNLAVLVNGATQEILGFEDITPVSGFTGRYKMENLYRARYDTEQYVWPAKSKFYFIGVDPPLVNMPALVKGNTRYFKFIFYNSTKSSDLSEADAVTKVITGRAWTPKKPGGFRVNNLSENSPGGPVYTSAMSLKWNPEIRGEGAGRQDPDTVVDTTITWEGYFEIVGLISGATAFTDTAINAATAAYTEGEIKAWNGGTLPDSVTFKLTNYINTSGVRYQSPYTSITVNKE